MQKIVTDPAFIKLQRIVSSCKTEQHFDVAKRYAGFVKKSILGKRSDTRSVETWFFGKKIDYFIEKLFEAYE